MDALKTIKALNIQTSMHVKEMSNQERTTMIELAKFNQKMKDLKIKRINDNRNILNLSDSLSDMMNVMKKNGQEIRK